MAFEGLSEKLSRAFKNLKQHGHLTESDVKVAMREIKLALWFLINAVAIAPYLYQIIWNKISLPLSFKIAVEIIAPIIASASIIIFYGGE